jgi:hypothetical protein
MRPVLIATAALVLAAGCGDDNPTTAAPTPSASASAASDAPAVSPTAANDPSPASRGCPAKGPGVPSDATTSRAVDVDGDGRMDTVWAVGSGGQLLAGITTASGATSRVTKGFAGGVGPFILAADADERGTIVVLVGNNRGQSLYRWSDCRIQPVLNPDGEQYGFDAGFAGNGTGIGCSRVKGAAHRDLVGLNLEGDASSPTRTVKRTQIVLDGLRAHNGLVDRLAVKKGSAAEASATTVSCGDLTPERGGASIDEG